MRTPVQVEYLLEIPSMLQSLLTWRWRRASLLHGLRYLDCVVIEMVQITVSADCGTNTFMM